jgi:hypothetical protein
MTKTVKPLRDHLDEMEKEKRIRAPCFHPEYVSGYALAIRHVREAMAEGAIQEISGDPYPTWTFGEVRAQRELEERRADNARLRKERADLRQRLLSQEMQHRDKDAEIARLRQVASGLVDKAIRPPVYESDLKTDASLGLMRDLLEEMDARNKASRNFDPQLASDLGKLQLWLAWADSPDNVPQFDTAPIATTRKREFVCGRCGRSPSHLVEGGPWKGLRCFACEKIERALAAGQSRERQDA